MNIAGLFQSPDDRIAAFAKAQVLLYRNDPTLHDYFMQLQLDSMERPRARMHDLRARSPLSTWVVNRAERAYRSRQIFKTDVLFCPMPYYGRESENRLLVRSLMGLAQTDAKILCLLLENAPIRAELDAKLKAAGREGQVEFIDPTACSSRMESRVRTRRVLMRADSAFRNTVSILEPHGLSPELELTSRFEDLARFIEGWEHLAPNVEFEAVVARCHWHALCSPVCRTALQRGKPVITFQQGVIGHTLDAPVTATKYVAFGRSSATFLERANHRFFEAAGMPEPQVDYVPGGSLIDDLKIMPEQFDRHTVLIVDIPTPQSNFYGVEAQSEALLDLADRLLAECNSLRQVVIRPHPFWSNMDFDACHRLAMKYPSRCEISHPAWSLDNDLRRSSAVVGIFSGVLTVAAACGIPTVFLQTDGGYKTGDLACFEPEQMLMPDAAFRQLSQMMTDKEAWAHARSVALSNAREYYEGGKNADLDGHFFDRLLHSAPREARTVGAT